MKTKIEKTFPKIGDQLYLRQFTGNMWVDEVKRPYTVIGVNPTEVIVQACELIAPIDPVSGKRVFYYDTIAETILPDPNGRVETLTWHAKRGKWGTPGPDSDYPEYAIFGRYEHQPYLN